MATYSRIALLLSIVPLGHLILVVAIWFYDRYIEHLPDEGEAGGVFAILMLLGLIAFLCWVAGLRMAIIARQVGGMWRMSSLVAVGVSGLVFCVWGVLIGSAILRAL